jgi:hypothetical protein
MRRTRTCATSLIPSVCHGSARFGASRFALFRGCGARDGDAATRRGRGDEDGGRATLFTLDGAAGRACFCTVTGAGFWAARSTEPPEQPAARIGTRTQLAARPVDNGYPVNFGCAFVGVAAGAVPPPPPVVVVVSVAVVSVDVEPVDEPVEVSGVVVVIVVTTVVLPVVIVVTIVVVASAPNGAAPAVNAAVAAPSVISVANAAPQIAYFLYCLLMRPPFSILGLQRRFTHPPNTYSPWSIHAYTRAG